MLHSFSPVEISAACQVIESLMPERREFVAMADGMTEPDKRLARYQYLAGRLSVQQDLQNQLRQHSEDQKEVADGLHGSEGAPSSIIES